MRENHAAHPTLFSSGHELARLEHFILKHDPMFAEQARGVDAAKIELFENDTGSTLPSIYRDFLLRCGEHSAGLDLLGLKWDHAFSAIHAEDLEENHVPNAVLRVGVNTDHSAISPQDLYLDLREPPHDELLMIEPHFEHADFGTDWIHPVGLRLLDWMTDRAFTALRVERRVRRRFLLKAENETRQAELIARAQGSFTSQGLQLDDASTDRVLLFEGETSARILARNTNHFVHFTLVADRPAHCDDMERLLRIRVPGLSPLRNY